MRRGRGRNKVLGQTGNQIPFGGADEVINTQKVTNLICTLFLSLFLTFFTIGKAGIKRVVEGYRRKVRV